MSATINAITDLPKEIVAEVKEQSKPATTSGITTQVVGFAVGIPLSMLYDWLYSLIAEKAITNEIARDVIKVAMPLTIALAVHVAKIPFGNLIAGTGYAIALISAGRIIYTRVKAYFGKTPQVGDVPEGYEGATVMDDVEAEQEVWGVQ